ncbi:hypothetical protein BOTBODRAFT_27237 [Botryobasidium botryosum FD-172 SS1]|uniref:Mini-chromosome maintenance complex-binding protein n=1 Tax=Botryobasidium botryosum (strain FD-172 SS1) TaxID=930990 RepID=A0A067N6U8_BOTB1|nr:hypothetical protein BOTBODRAFT_27237 [Botryobasidium botryosum FD-172 SS1]
MVSAMLCDALTSPTKSLVALYSSLTANGQAIDFPTLAPKHFKNIFSSQKHFSQIPPLDVRHPPSAYSPRSLVRFRAMVQDTSLSQEIYLSSFGDGKPGGWGLEDEALVDDEDVGDIDHAKLRERTVIWAVSIPGEAEWVSEFIEDSEEPGGTQALAAPLEAASRAHKFPDPSCPHIGAFIKLYDASESTPKSTEIYTFVGVLTSESRPELAPSENAPVYPTLHVLFSIPRPPTITPFPYPFSAGSPEASPIGDVPLQADVDHGVLELRNELISWIADEALGGDKEAAEWVVLTCVGKVRSRAPQLNPLSLTISNFPSSPTPPDAKSSSVPTVAAILSHILPITAHLPLSLSLLNTSSFVPEYHEEDLHSGRLQLPAGTTVLVEETGMTEGKVVEKGLRNITALQQCIASQSISYVFPYSTFSFSTDLTFIVLSEGKKSAFVDTDVNIRLRDLSAEPAEFYKPADRINVPPPAKLEAFRRLVGGAKNGQVTISESVSKFIQDDFVKERRDMKGTTSEDLALRMSAARVMALSMHEKEVTQCIWERVKVLDQHRKAAAAAF